MRVAVRRTHIPHLEGTLEAKLRGHAAPLLAAARLLSHVNRLIVLEGLSIQEAVGRAASLARTWGLRLLYPLWCGCSRLPYLAILGATWGVLGTPVIHDTPTPTPRPPVYIHFTFTSPLEWHTTSPPVRVVVDCAAAADCYAWLEGDWNYLLGRREVVVEWLGVGRVRVGGWLWDCSSCRLDELDGHCSPASGPVAE